MEQKCVKCKNIRFNPFNFDGKAVEGAEMLNGRAENKQGQGRMSARELCRETAARRATVEAAAAPLFRCSRLMRPDSIIIPSCVRSYRVIINELGAAGPPEGPRPPLGDRFHSAF